MNKLSKLLCGLAILGFATGCSDDLPSGSEQPGEKAGDVYARLTLSLPGSRSQTTSDKDDPESGSGVSNAGYEVGKDYENSVSSILVVLAQENAGSYHYITSTVADNKSGQDEGNSEQHYPAYTVTFSSEEIQAVAGKQVWVFAVCNPTPQIVEKVTALKPADPTDVGGILNDLECSLDEDGRISDRNRFLMSNASLASVILPSSETLAQKHNSPDKPFFLGTVDVNRATARFDFRQTNYTEGEGDDKKEFGLNRYPIYDDYAVTTEQPKVDADGNPVLDEDGEQVYETVTTEGTQLMGYVNIVGMALMNEAQNYYLFPRVSPTGMGKDNSLCGREIRTNFVVSPGYDEKILNPLNLGWLSANYNDNGLPSPLPENGKAAYNYGSFNFEALDVSIDDDNEAGWITGADFTEDKSGYRIWKYVTENTIPGNDLDGINSSIEYQRIGVTTCIVFKAEIEPTEDSPIKEQMKNGKNIYCFDNRLIGDMEHLKEEVKKYPVSALADAFAAAVEANNVTDIESLNDFDVTGLTSRGEGLKIFKPEDGKYYCYYIYRNRHNDNLLSYRMGPMEFATVRNNIYKIDIQSVLEFGHTEDPSRDPDPETPETPDEPNKTYFRLSVRVLPWVVRVNHAVL